jgi:dipeptidyl aminopeptidase/acylaminoacyl peptidase
MSKDDGFTLGTWITLPAGTPAERPAPLIVAPHGRPQTSWSGWSRSW